MSIPLSDAAVQALIISDLDIDAADIPDMHTNMPQWYIYYAGKEILGNGLQVLYTKRAVIDFLLGRERKKMTIQIGQDKIATKDRFDNLRLLREDVLTEIRLIERRTNCAVVGVSPVSALPDAYTDELTRLNSFGEWQFID